MNFYPAIHSAVTWQSLFHLAVRHPYGALPAAAVLTVPPGGHLAVSTWRKHGKARPVAALAPGGAARGFLSRAYGLVTDLVGGR